MGEMADYYDPEGTIRFNMRRHLMSGASKEKPVKKPRGSVQIFAVAGVTFADGYPANLKRLDAAIKEVESHRHGTHLQGQNEGPAVVLVRNPANEYDSNAIEVHVPAIALGPDSSGMIGHVPKALATRWAPLLDAGAQVLAWVDGVRVKKGHENRPGIDIRTEWPAKNPPAPKSPMRQAIDQSIGRAADDADVAWAPGFEPVVIETEADADGYEWAWTPSDEL